MKNPAIIRSIFFFLCVIIYGCSKTPTVKSLPLSDPLNELVRIAEEENNLNIIVTPFAHTVWIYLPFEKNFLAIKGTAKGPLNSAQSSTKPSIKFLDGWFENGRFHLKYDIGPVKGYAKDYGYASKFTEEYQTAQRQILSAITRAYSGYEDSDKNGKPPDFFVIVIADTVNGLEARVLLYFNDLKRANVDQSFHEEYAKRVISEQPFGGEKIIGDKEGRHIDYKEITWGEFLARQMVFRVNFKYQRSSFPASNDTRKELLTIAADTITAYNFTDFTSIQLHNVDDGTSFTTAKDDLSAYKSESSKGRLIHIRFQ